MLRKKKKYKTELNNTKNLNLFTKKEKLILNDKKHKIN